MALSIGSEEDLINLGIDVQSEAFQQIKAELGNIQTQTQSLNATFEEMAAAQNLSYEASQRLLATTAEQIASIDDLANAFRQENLQGEIDKMVALASATRQEAEAAASLSEEYDRIHQFAAGYGTEGGMPGPAGPSEAGGGGGSTGSLFGVGHALSVAGFMTGAPGLKEAGAAVYMEEGIRRVIPLFEQLNDIIAASPGFLGPAIEGLTALGVPMAGLVVVVLPVVAALTAVVLAFKAFNDGLADAKRALEAALSTQKGYYDFAQTATTEQAQDQMLKLNNQAEAARKARGETEKALQGLESQTGISRGVGITLPGAIGDPFRLLTKQLDDNNKAVAEAEAAVGRLTGGLQSNAFAANDAAAAALKKAEYDSNFQKQEASDLQMTSEAAKKRLDQLQAEGPIIQGQMDTLKPFIATNEEARKKYQELDAQLKADQGEILALTNDIMPLILAREAEAEAAKKDEQAVKDATKAHEEYEKAIKSAQDQLANQTATALAREGQQEQQYQEGSLQDTFERNKIRLDESRKETALALDNANAIADARTKLGQKEFQLATDYNRQLFDDDFKFRNDWAKLESNAQAKQREDLSNHFNKLDDINRQATYNQESALLDRNFLALAKNEANKQREIDQENLSFSRKEGQLNENLHQQEIDLVNNLTRERQQQQVAYERKLADAELNTANEIQHQNVNEQRKLMALQTSESQQLSDLTTMENYKIQVLRQGLQNELMLYQQQEQQRIQIAQQTQAQLISQAWSTIGANFATNPTAAIQAAWQMAPATISSVGSQIGSTLNRFLGMPLFDAGGSFGPGEMFMKGPGPETLRIGSGAYTIPGAAIVMPMQGGTASGVNNNSQIGSINNHIYGNNGDPAQVANIASQMMLKTLRNFFGVGL